MGYRSDVMCIMYAARSDGTVDEAGMAFIKAWLKNRLNEDALDLFDLNDDYMVVFEVDGWKWYESYDDIAMLDKLFADFIEICDEGDNNYHLEFIRIGEDYTDIEVRESNHCQGWLRVNRSIHVDRVYLHK